MMLTFGIWLLIEAVTVGQNFAVGGMYSQGTFCRLPYSLAF
jgi:hypothetical protein